MTDWIRLAATAELKTKDALDQVAEAVGVELDGDAYERLAAVERMEGLGSFGMPRLLAILARAVKSPEDLLYERFADKPWMIHCLLVRFTDGPQSMLAVGVKRFAGADVARPWPELKPWKRKLADNRARAEAWARMAGRCVLRVRGQVASLSHGADEAGLRAAVLANPDDDVPRLVYADWLEEHGNAQAQVIRKQLQLQKLPEYSDERRAIEAEVKRVLDAGWKDFAGPVAKYTSPKQFARGFVHTVGMTPTAFVKDGVAVFTREPVKRLWMKERNFSDADLEKIAKAPAAALIRELSMSQVPQSTARRPLSALAGGPGFAKLQKISFGFCGESPADWQLLLERLKAPAFEELHCHYNFGSTAMFRGFARNKTFGRFRLFDEYQYQSLDGAKAEGQLIDAVAELARTRSSFTTWKSGNNSAITDDVLAELYGKNSVIAMEHLELNNVPNLTDRTAKLIAAAPTKAAALKVFTTHNSGIHVEGVKVLLRAASNLHELRIVSFNDPKWTDDAWAALAEAVHALPKDAALKKLELRGSVSLSPALASALTARFGRWEN